MGELAMYVFQGAAFVSAVLMLIVGSLLVAIALISIALYLLKVTLYERTKAGFYFISYVRRRKEFIAWYKNEKPDVYTPDMGEEE